MMQRIKAFIRRRKPRRSPKARLFVLVMLERSKASKISKPVISTTVRRRRVVEGFARKNLFLSRFLDSSSLHSLGMSCARFYRDYIELTLNILIIQKKVLILYRNREKEIPSPYFVVT